MNKLANMQKNPKDMKSRRAAKTRQGNNVTEQPTSQHTTPNLKHILISMMEEIFYAHLKSNKNIYTDRKRNTNSRSSISGTSGGIFSCIECFEALPGSLQSLLHSFNGCVVPSLILLSTKWETIIGRHVKLMPAISLLLQFLFHGNPMRKSWNEIIFQHLSCNFCTSHPGPNQKNVSNRSTTEIIISQRLIWEAMNVSIKWWPPAQTK